MFNRSGVALFYAMLSHCLKGSSPIWGLVIVLVLHAGAVVEAQVHHHSQVGGGDREAALQKLGTVDMPISCAASVQTPFERGIALLHSFWYEEAAKQFRSVVAADPKCSMAYWGIAMTEWRPFWDGLPPERRDAGRIEIDRAVELHPKSDRERRYVAALSSYLHADSTEGSEPLRRYVDAMDSLYTAYPEDVEAQAFYGLALASNIGQADPLGDARKAISVLEPGFRAHPDHPGFAHYMIHTCDSPQLAGEGLLAAEKYAAIAPSSPHALHMPGHIFARLGMWREDIDSNLASVRASEYAEKHSLGGVTHEFHALEFLLYAYLQQGDDAKAKFIIDNLESTASHLRSLPGIENDGMEHFLTYFEVELPSIYHLEMHEWKAVLAIREPKDAIPSARYFRSWSQAIAAGHLRDAATADAAVALASRWADETEKEQSPIGLEIAVSQATIKAWQSFAHRKDEQALEEIRVAADIQDRVGQAEVDIPAREMFADMLLAENRPTEALVQYRVALRLSPNRFDALYNAGQAAEAAGKPEDAAAFYRQLLKVTNGGANTLRPEVRYSRSFLDHLAVHSRLLYGHDLSTEAP